MSSPVFTRKGRRIARPSMAECRLFGFGSMIVGGGSAAPPSPLTILGAKARAWYDLADTATLLSTIGGSVAANTGTFAQVSDKSGNGLHATITSGTKPTRQDASVNGTTSGLWTGSEGHLITGTIPFTGLRTVSAFIVLKQASGTCDAVCVNGDPTSYAGIDVALTSASTHYLYRNANDAVGFDLWSGTPSPALTAGATECIYAECTLNGTTDTYVFETNGVAQVGWTQPITRNHTGTFDSLAYWLFGAPTNGILVGNGCEVVLCNAACTSGEKTSMYSYLRPKWGFP